MKTFKTIGELIDSLEIAEIKQYLFDLFDDKFIVRSSDERAQFYIELSFKTNPGESVSVSNSKFREFKNQLELAEIILTMLSLTGDDSSIYEIWVLNSNSFNIRFKPEVAEGIVKTVINSRMLVQFDGDNMNLTFNATVTAQNDKDDLIDYVFNGNKKTFDIVNLTVREINDKISGFTTLESDELKANVEIVKLLLNREPSDLTD